MGEVILDSDWSSQAGGYSPSERAIPIVPLSVEDWSRAAPTWAECASAAHQAGFTGRPGEIARQHADDGALVRVLFGVGRWPTDPALFRGLAARLPPGVYRILFPDDHEPPSAIAGEIVVAWMMGTYRFDRYRRTPNSPAPALIPPTAATAFRARALGDACALARDLVNTPANDMGPAELEAAARLLASAHGANLTAIVGDALLEAGYPAVHAVGRAATAARAPRMIEITWGEPTAPKVVVIGKGVVFDTGGLDIKPSAGMRLMKKDMGGAAHALALASMIMECRTPVQLSVLLPVVENAISGDAMRPGDILSSRAGLSIEVGNTDAEGRLILADALTRAGELEPELTIDLATLTGAARVALGPQVIPFFTDDESLAADLAAASAAVADPLWRLPMWSGYEAALDSDVADIKNDPDGWAQAGSITAAMFLRRFAPKGAWVHLDVFAWNPRNRPGWPVGGEAQSIRALFAMIEGRYG